MAIITVAEPNTLVRLGILNLIQALDRRMTAIGLDYTQLFQGPATRHLSIDLMLLSVPDNYSRVAELIAAAHQGYAPRRILLLSDTPSPSYSLLNLPGELAGYLYKYSSQDVLKTSVLLVLAGGKCFPNPGPAHASQELESSAPGEAPKRRWYDSGNPPQEPAPDAPARADLPPPALHPAPRQPSRPAATSTATRKAASYFQAPTMDRINQEACILQLTPRQYEVLAMLAQGYPLKKVSRELDISVATAKTHAEALYQRLGVNNRNAAVYIAMSRGATFGWRSLATQDPDAKAGSVEPSPGAHRS